MKYLKKFNEGVREYSDLESPYTVGDLKEYINELPDDMPVILFDETMNQPRPNFIATINVEELDNLRPDKHPTEGEALVIVI